MTTDKKAKISAALPDVTKEQIREELRRRKFNKFNEIFPEDGPLSRHKYAKHMEFFAAGSKFRERLFRAGNRTGKSEAGAYEITCHLTGNYPKWWKGKRFNHAANVLIAGETAKLVRDSIQEKLLGPPGEIGSGLIPHDLILETRPRAGIADAIDVARIRHESGDVSTLSIQSYDQGREAFQATARDVVWLDEEPPLSIYTEALTRTMTTNGIVMITFTPLRGMSETIQFLEKKAQDGKISLITATWDDAPHLTEQAKEEMMAAFPPHQRDARTKGIPALGSGAIYPIPESDFVIPPIQIAKHWKHVYGMDVGWNNTAAVFCAYDADSDVLYVVGDYKRGQVEPAVHASAIKMRAKGERQPGVIDPAAGSANQIDGRKVIDLYRGLGLNLQEAENAVEAGIFEVWARLSSGRLKVFSSCQKLIDEYRIYRRDERGRVVKENDHCMDCLRYAVMSGVKISRPSTPQKKKSIFADFIGGGGSWMGN
jgi:phage terminase large subunit-like protein